MYCGKLSVILIECTKELQLMITFSFMIIKKCHNYVAKNVRTRSFSPCVRVINYFEVLKGNRFLAVISGLRINGVKNMAT